MLSPLYGQIARYRRRWYARHPDARRRLSAPVVSVGNLTVGGSGKTPTVAHLAALLAAEGERPSILSRGYGRADAADGVVVVRGPHGVMADLARAGDEPLMLARTLDHAAVLVATDRYLAGRLAERQFGATVHLLDDGFQHLALERDVDLLLVDRRDLEGARLLPFGRLREPLEAASAADAIVAVGSDAADARRLASVLGVGLSFTLDRRPGAPRLIEPYGAPVAPGAGPAIAMAGIAKPERFFADVRGAGWPIVDEVAVGDHHRYTRADVANLAARARAAGATLAIVTAKDAVRLLPLRPLGMPVAWLPLEVAVEPAGAFRSWLVDRIQAARDRRAAAGRTTSRAIDGEAKTDEQVAHA